MFVRAKVAHLEPPSGKYRNEGEEFEHEGTLYKHVDPVKKSKAAKAEEKPEDE